ncbi:unnamed protein product [Fraxinus pennsylvanica]|uniref:Uncharacterized protein n=1 Tax=Fraxinus pennsylvanica TaxID=56036 RepID=A0AAD2E796_9LAMI|nr:unnamed protein product [Fraxinus pennsylvanica]
MSKGHTIPLLHLARLLLDRGSAGTFPEFPGIESTEKLPSVSLFLSFAKATKLMLPYFESSLQKIPHVTRIILDQFLHWTVESAMKFGIQLLGFNGMSNYFSRSQLLIYIASFFIMFGLSPMEAFHPSVAARISAQYLSTSAFFTSLAALKFAHSNSSMRFPSLILASSTSFSGWELAATSSPSK